MTCDQNANENLELSRRVRLPCAYPDLENSKVKSKPELKALREMIEESAGWKHVTADSNLDETIAESVMTI